MNQQPDTAEQEAKWFRRLRRYFRHYPGPNGETKTLAELQQLSIEVTKNSLLWSAILKTHGPELDPPYDSAPSFATFKPPEANHWRSTRDMHNYWTKRLIRFYKHYDSTKSEAFIKSFVRSVHWSHWNEVWHMLLEKYGPEPITTGADTESESLLSSKLSAVEVEHEQRRLAGAREQFKVRLCRYIVSRGLEKSYNEIDALCAGVPTENLEEIWDKMNDEIGPPREGWRSAAVPREFWKHLLQAYEPQLDPYQLEDVLDEYSKGTGGLSQMALGLEAKYELPPKGVVKEQTKHLQPQHWSELGRAAFWAERVRHLQKINDLPPLSGQALNQLMDRFASIGWEKGFRRWCIESKLSETTETLVKWAAYREHWNSEAVKALARSRAFEATGELSQAETRHLRIQEAVDQFFEGWPTLEEDDERDSTMYWKRACQAAYWHFTGETLKIPQVNPLTVQNAQNDDNLATSFAEPRLDPRHKETRSGTAIKDPLEPNHVYQYWSDRLLRFYELHCPHKATQEHVESILDRVPLLQRDAMWRMLIQKYGSPPPSRSVSVESETASDIGTDTVPVNPLNTISYPLVATGPSASPATIDSTATVAEQQPTHSRDYWRERITDYCQLKDLGKSALEIEVALDDFYERAKEVPNSDGGALLYAALEQRYGTWEEPDMTPTSPFWRWAIRKLVDHHHIEFPWVEQSRVSSGKNWMEMYRELEGTYGAPFDLVILFHEFAAEKRFLARGAAKEGAVQLPLSSRAFWERKMEDVRRKFGVQGVIKPQAIQSILDAAILNNKSFEVCFTDFVKICVSAIPSTRKGTQK
jgi:hypothetical protein